MSVESPVKKDDINRQSEIGSVRTVDMTNSGDRGYMAEQLREQTNSQHYFSNQLSADENNSGVISKGEGFQNIQLPEEKQSGKNNGLQEPMENTLFAVVTQGAPTSSPHYAEDNGGDSPYMDSLESLKAQLQRLQTLIEQLERKQFGEHQLQSGTTERPPTSELTIETTGNGDFPTKDNKDSPGDYGNSAGILEPSPGEMPPTENSIFVAGGNVPHQPSTPYSNMLAEAHPDLTTHLVDTSTYTELPPTEDTKLTTNDVLLTADENASVAKPQFNPDSINNLAKDEFNPLNPLNGVDLQNYLGGQDGNGHGFDPTKLNTNIAENGMQGIGNYGVTKVPNTDIKEIPNKADANPARPDPGASNGHQTSLQSGGDQTIAEDLPATEILPTTATNDPIANEIATHESALSQINLMNPSGMLGMTHAGRPGMAGAEPQNMFSVNKNEQSPIVGWSSAHSEDGGSHSASASGSGKVWFGTGSPGEGLLRPFMANPVDPLGIRQREDRTSSSSTTKNARTKREAESSRNLQTAMLFGFDPNNMMMRGGDKDMNQGFGGCCNIPDRDNSVTGNSASRPDTSTVTRPGKTEIKSDSDFGLTATNNHVRKIIQADLKYNQPRAVWKGDWSDAPWAGSSNQSSEKNSEQGDALSNQKSALSDLIHQSPHSDNSNDVTSHTEAGSWAGQWREAWPNVGVTHKSRGVGDDIESHLMTSPAMIDILVACLKQSDVMSAKTCLPS